MLSNDSNSLPAADVHVIGGGLGGLTAAAMVARSGRTVVVHEQLGGLGGRAATDDVHGYRFNRGPHALYLGGEGAAVLRRLGVVPTGSAPATAGAQMMFGGSTYLAPGGPASLLRTRLLGTRDKADVARVLRRLPALDPAAVASRSVRELVDELTGRERVAALVHALIRLTGYVNAPDQLSAEVAVTQLQRGLGSGVMYLDNGWEQIVEALATVVTDAGGVIRIGQGPTTLPDAAAVIVAVGGPAAAAALVGHGYPAGTPSSVSSLDLGLRRAPRHPFVIGVDEPIYLSDHGRPAGMTPDGAASVSLANYLAPGDQPDRARLEAFARHSGIAAGEVVEARYLHRMTTVTAIATAETGGLSGRSDVAVPDRPGVFVVGDWVGRRGHLADAVMASAEDAAAAAIRHVERRPVAR